jgi:hypothetical protein
VIPLNFVKTLKDNRWLSGLDHFQEVSTARGDAARNLHCEACPVFLSVSCREVKVERTGWEARQNKSGLISFISPAKRI